MRGEPPQGLIDLVARLNLATASQVHGVAPRVRRLAGELPDFESVWVDALAQARVLTHLQACEINAGRGDALLCGPYVLSHPLASPHYCECFAARHIDTARVVRLYRVRRPQIAAAATAGQLARLIEQLAPLAGPVASVVEDAGIIADGAWAACPGVEGTTAADWMAENGRFPPSIVLHIARQMLARLADLELLGAVHGDVSAAGLVMQSSGQVILPMPALRGVVRPCEGYGFNDLPPEAYDYLAPERIGDGCPPTLAGDSYACGCLWWHLLAGRPPFAGGNSLGKLKAVHAAKVIDVRQLAPDVPSVLLRAIDACLAREPQRRPQSPGQLLDLVGPPARGGRAILSRCLTAQPWLWQTLRPARRARARRRKRALGAAAGAATICALVVGLSLVLRGDRTDLPAGTVADRAASSPATVQSAKRAPTATSARALTGGEAGHVDPHVIPAAAREPAANTPPDDLLLPGGETLRLSELDLRAGQRVRGRPGQRPRVSVSAAGLHVWQEDVCFEGIDFAWDPRSPDSANPTRAPAMLALDAQSAQFRGCSFMCAGDAPPVAIGWNGAADATGGYGGQLTISDCVFEGLAAVVDCRGANGLSVEMINTLCVASGPIVRLHGCPRVDKSLAITLARTTTRGDSAVLECRYSRLEAEPGPIEISVSDSALVTNPGGGLLIFAGPQRPDVLLRAVSWSGHGSLVTPDTAVAVWRSRADKVQVLPEDELAMAGLVRSEVEFAGSADGPPAASSIIRWQVPLRSPDPPGANTSALVAPDR